jgi:hypothetical protein
MAQRELETILEEARAEIAAGRSPDGDSLRARLRSAGGDEQALKQLDRVLAIHRARGRLSRSPAAPAAAPLLRAALKTKPTINANMDVRREPGFVLAWDTLPAVVGWEVRVSERPSVRGDYVVRETAELPGNATRFELPLGDQPVRVHLLGRARDGRLLRRAVMSGLTRGGWNERWQRRASAS